MHIKAMIVQRAYNFSQKVEMTFAEGGSLVGTRILNRKKYTVMYGDANPYTMQQHELRVTRCDPFARGFFAFKHFYPLHRE